MTLLQRLQDVPTVVQPESPPFVPIRPETRDAVVALVEVTQDFVSQFGDARRVSPRVVARLRDAVAVFTEDKP